LKIVFAGTPEFAANVLAALVQSRHAVVAVLTQPDKPAGRGLAFTASPVKRFAVENRIRVDQPSSLKDFQTQELLRQLQPDIMVVAAYGLILPQTVLDIPRLGAINIHASLLPRWRGAAPIQRALMAGDRETGITIMQMDAGLDTGPILLSEAVPIADEDTAGSLHDRLAGVGARLMVWALDRLELGELSATPQAAEGMTYAAKIDKREMRLNWQQAATQVWHIVRAFDPMPGASTNIRNTGLKIWRCKPNASRNGFPGEVLSVSGEGVEIACGVGSILVTELQRAGGKRLHAREFLQGFPLKAGERFDL